MSVDKDTYSIGHKEEKKHKSIQNLKLECCGVWIPIPSSLWMSLFGYALYKFYANPLCHNTLWKYHILPNWNTTNMLVVCMREWVSYMLFRYRQAPLADMCSDGMCSVGLVYGGETTDRNEKKKNVKYEKPVWFLQYDNHNSQKYSGTGILVSTISRFR